MSSIRTAAVCAALLAAGVAAAQQDGSIAARQHRIDANAQQALDALFAASPQVKALYRRAAGYAAFTATKAGFFVTGGGGTGVVLDKASGRRTYMRMGTGGIGLGIGAQRYSLVILFEDATHLNRFLQGGWDASATATAAAGKDGVAVRSSFVDGVAFYQLTKKGLMAQADVSGTRFWKIDELNRNGVAEKGAQPAPREPEPQAH
jgi:lipid-binding SYLF domain-containing protein